MNSIDRLAKNHCRRVVPFSRKSKGVKPDRRLQLIEKEEEAAAASLRKSSSQEAVVMNQRHQKRLKSLKLEVTTLNASESTKSAPIMHPTAPPYHHINYLINNSLIEKAETDTKRMMIVDRDVAIVNQILLLQPREIRSSLAAILIRNIPLIDYDQESMIK